MVASYYKICCVYVNLHCMGLYSGGMGMNRSAQLIEIGILSGLLGLIAEYFGRFALFLLYLPS